MKRSVGRPPLDEDDEASVPVCLRLPPRIYDAVDERSKRAGVTVPEIIRRDMRKAAQKRYQK